MAAITRLSIDGYTAKRTGSFAGRTIQDISPSSIASSEAYGTPVVSLTCLPNSIASSQSVGTPVVSLTIQPPTIATSEAIGTPTLSIFGVFPVSIASSETYGTPVVSVPVVAAGGGKKRKRRKGLGSIVSIKPKSFTFEPVIEVLPVIPLVQKILNAGNITSSEVIGTPVVSQHIVVRGMGLTEFDRDFIGRLRITMADTSDEEEALMLSMLL